VTIPSARPPGGSRDDTAAPSPKPGTPGLPFADESDDPRLARLRRHKKGMSPEQLKAYRRRRKEVPLWMWIAMGVGVLLAIVLVVVLAVVAMQEPEPEPETGLQPATASEAAGESAVPDETPAAEPADPTLTDDPAETGG
jgi:hypothetical protein